MKALQLGMLALGLPLVAGAQEDKAESWRSHGDLRWIGSALTDFPVDAEGTMIGQSMWLDQRIRLGFSEEAEAWAWEVEWDLASGQVAGDTWDIPGEVDDRGRHTHSAFANPAIVPRKFSGLTVVGNTQLAFGLTTSHWGLGMVANDGAHDPLFGRADFGDRVIRFRATALPTYSETPSRDTVLLTAAADWVVGDDISQMNDAQQAVQGILSALWMRGNGAKYGVYAVGRQQWEVAESRNTQAFVLDLYADAPHELGDSGWTLRTAGELAGIVGSTNKSTTYNSTGRQAIARLGGAGILTLISPEERFQAHLRGGFASGDGDPDDPTNHDFTFDRDFAAGTVLFDQVIGGVEAATHAQLTDPENSGKPPDGVDGLVTEGAMSRAAFLQPAVQYAPAEFLDLRVGATVSFATAPVSQPFYTYRAGGTPHNHHNLPSQGRLLGTEANWAALAHVTKDVPAVPSFEVHGGHLILGPALKGAGPGVIHHVMGVGRVRW